MTKHRFMKENFRKKSYHRMGQSGETPEMFSYFVKYRSLPREEREDLEAVADIWDVEPELVFALHKKYEWRRRASDFDAEAEKQLHYKRLRNIRKLEEKQAYIGQLAQKFGTDQLHRLMEQARHADGPAVTVGMAMGLMDFGLKHERVAYGEPSDIVGQKAEVTQKEAQDDELDLSNLSSEEIKALIHLQRKARGLDE